MHLANVDLILCPELGYGSKSDRNFQPTRQIHGSRGTHNGGLKDMWRRLWLGTCNGLPVCCGSQPVILFPRPSGSGPVKCCKGFSGVYEGPVPWSRTDQRMREKNDWTQSRDGPPSKISKWLFSKHELSGSNSQWVFWACRFPSSWLKERVFGSSLASWPWFV